MEALPGYKEIREVYATNTGALSLYVRAKTDVGITLNDRYSEYQDEIDTSLVIFDIDDEYWRKSGDFYYYSVALQGGETTPVLFSEIKFSESMGNIYKDSTIKVTVLFEIVQANNNGATPEEAVGWPSGSEGGAP